MEMKNAERTLENVEFVILTEKKKKFFDSILCRLRWNHFFDMYVISRKGLSSVTFEAFDDKTIDVYLLFFRLFISVYGIKHANAAPN